MADRIVIPIEAQFVDRVSSGMKSAAKSADKLEKSVSEANKELDKASRKNAKPKLGADDNAFTKKIRQAENRLQKMGRTKSAATLGLVDKASTKLGQIASKAKSFGSKSYKATVNATDKASRVINKIDGTAKSFAGKTFRATVGIIDKATSPLRKIKNSLFNIKTLIGAVVAGAAVQKVTQVGVANPLNLADAYSSAKIGFSTLLGDEGGQQMMDDLDEFAKATPFKTSGVIENAQKMMAMGWDAKDIIKDMETIGDAAAATGKMDQGLESIVRALSQIKTKGKLSTEELNQLSEAGIAAKAMLAEQLGYGTGDSGIAAMTKDLEDGLIGSDVAIQALLAGMEQFDGTMKRTANETVEGLKSQLEDTFEINVFRKWGQGLQDGAKKGLGTILDLLDSSEEALANFGDMLYDIGKEISNWGADKLEKLIGRIKEITETDVFKNASLGDKIKMLWKGIIVNPLEEWWENGGQEKTASTAGKIGNWLGETFKNILLGIFGITDLLNDDGNEAKDQGVSVAQSFAKGFADGFDASVVTDKLVEAISNVWNALPTWAKFLVGGYVGGKAISGFGNVLSGIGTIVGGAKNIWGTAGGMAVNGAMIAPSGIRGFIGTPGNAMMQGTGLLNTFANAGYALTGGAATSTLTPAMASLAGSASITGGLLAGATVIKGGVDLYGAYKAYKQGDDTEAKAKATSGGYSIGGVATGAAIGSIFGPVGTLVGAGIGGLAGWVSGDILAKNIRSANVESEELKNALEDSDASSEEIAMAMERAAKTKLAERFGDIELSMEEINKLAKNVVFGDEAKNMEKFATATATAEQSLEAYKTAAADMERLNFDMSERSWKMEMGLETKLSEDEIEQVKSRVQSYIKSAEQVLSDQHYKFNAAVEVLLNPVEGEENSSYEQLISDGNSMYAKLQKELDALTEDLTVKYDLYLEDGVITADEQGTLSRIQGKIAEIMEKVSNAETEASFEVSKIKFTTGDLSAESFEQFQASLQSQLESYQAEQEEALTVAISEINLELEEGTITQDQYDDKLKTLVDNYNTNIDNMTAKVSNIQLEGISDAFDGVATVEQIQGAIDSLVSSGENPLELTFDDINAHLNLPEDALSEDDKLAFVDVMQSAIESAASGENALKTTAEVDPTIEVDSEKITERKNALWQDLSDQISGGGEDGSTSITPTLNVDPDVSLAEGSGESIKSEYTTQVSSYLTGENSISTTATVHAAANMYGTDGIALSEEANNGRTEVDSAIDTAMTNPFSASADANITLNWKITNPTATLGFSGGGGNGSTVSATVTGNAGGGIITGGPQLSWLDEENRGEAVIPFNPSRRARALQLYAETGRRLGVLNHAEGGIVGGESAPIQPFKGEVPTGSGEQKIEINMGGVNIEIKADGNKSMIENIEDQEQEIAERVAAIFKNVFSAQFANMPVKGGV